MGFLFVQTPLAGVMSNIYVRGSVAAARAALSGAGVGMHYVAVFDNLLHVDDQA